MPVRTIRPDRICPESGKTGTGTSGQNQTLDMGRQAHPKSKTDKYYYPAYREQWPYGLGAVAVKQKIIDRGGQKNEGGILRDKYLPNRNFLLQI